jgi:hypothetical protein
MLNVKRAKLLTGGLGSPSKMPGLSYGLPAAGAQWVPAVCADLGLPVPPTYGCVVGALLADIQGTVCSGCYADERGMYKLSNPRQAQVRRLTTLYASTEWDITQRIRQHDSSWTMAMAYLIDRSKEPYFRWHDSGDLLGVWHLYMITEVCRATPRIHHWLPTREAKVVASVPRLVIPKNLTIRLSATKVDAPPPKATRYTSTVDHRKPTHGYQCPAPTQGNECGPCRECWHKRKRNVSYHLH